MIVRISIFILCLVLSGCSSTLSLPFAGEPVSSATDASAMRQHCDISSVEAAVDKMTLLPDGFVVADAALLENDPESLVLDLETLADTLLLTGFEQHPPEDEGQSIPAVVPLSDFPVVKNAKVEYFITYYTGPGRRTFSRWLARSGRYLPMMQEIFAGYGLPQDLAYLAMVESGFNERAYSWAHAVGPWQFIESTGVHYGLENSWWLDERRDFEKSTHAAARFLADLYRQFDGNWYLAVASYNAGGGKLRRAIKKYHSTDFWVLARGDYLQTETKNYLPKLLAVLLIAKQPEKYGFNDVEYQPPLVYSEVALPSATDLDVIASLSGSDYQEIKRLNPELKRWSTPPDEIGYVLRLPVGTHQRFVKEYAALNPADRIKYLHHRIKSGDTLLELSKRHGIRVEDIVALNSISNPRALRVGTDLVLPLKKGYTSQPLDEMQDDYIRTRRRTYKVRNGDSLWKIANKFDVTQKQLRVWNRLGWSNIIRPGQTLVVSSKGAKAPTRKARSGPVKKIVYQVRSGDSLWTIGRRYSVATQQIMNWNNLSENHILHPGDKLTLMVSSGTRG